MERENRERERDGKTKEDVKKREEVNRLNRKVNRVGEGREEKKSGHIKDRNKCAQWHLFKSFSLCSHVVVSQLCSLILNPLSNTHQPPYMAAKLLTNICSVFNPPPWRLYGVTHHNFPSHSFTLLFQPLFIYCIYCFSVSGFLSLTCARTHTHGHTHTQACVYACTKQFDGWA